MSRWRFRDGLQQFERFFQYPALPPCSERLRTAPASTGTPQ